jgi:hypothetical protein
MSHPLMSEKVCEAGGDTVFRLAMPMPRRQRTPLLRQALMVSSPTKLDLTGGG